VNNIYQVHIYLQIIVYVVLRRQY